MKKWEGEREGKGGRHLGMNTKAGLGYRNLGKGGARKKQNELQNMRKEREKS